MKAFHQNSRAATRGFTVVEVMVSMAVFSMLMAAVMSTFLFGLRTMY